MNKYKNFPQEFWSKIDQALDLELKHNPHPVAAFDADGTLWDTDLGEHFFQWQIQNANLPLPQNPWKYYRNWKESGDPRPAYLWLAQINQGQKLSQVHHWANEALKTLTPLPFFQEQKKLVDLLHAKGVQVFVVTASVKWSVEPGAALYNIPRERVLGVQTELSENEVVTDKQKGPITWREGKLEALLLETKGIKPFLCSGNTMGDISLLQGATRIALAVSAAKESDELYPAEIKLQNEATQKGWLQHRF